MELYPKFIIEDDSLIISKVSYHKHIATDVSKVKGGGWFKWVEQGEGEKRMLVFYGESTDFGKATIEDIKECIQSGNVFTNKYQTHSIATEYKFGYDIGSDIIPLN